MGTLLLQDVRLLNPCTAAVFSSLRTRPVSYHGLVFSSAEMLALSIRFLHAEALTAPSHELRARLCAEDASLKEALSASAASCTLSGAIARIVGEDPACQRALGLSPLPAVQRHWALPHALASCAAYALQLTQHRQLLENLMKHRRALTTAARASHIEQRWTSDDVLTVVVRHIMRFRSARNVARDAKRVLTVVRLHYRKGRSLERADIGQLLALIEARVGRRAKMGAFGLGLSL